MRNIGKMFRVLGIHQATMCELEPDDDTVGSMAYIKHTQFEYHDIDDNYPLTLDLLDSKQFSEVMEFLNDAHYKICFNNNKFSGQHDNFDNFTQNRPYCLYYPLWLQHVPHFCAYTVPSLSDGVA
jgi:hypothetical protein